MRRAGVAAVVALMATTLVACGDDDEVCSQPDGAGCFTDPDPQGGDEPNDADEDYVLETALPASQIEDLAELAIETSDDPVVLDLAAEIAEAADDLRDQLAGWEEDWDLDPIVYDSTASVSSLTVPRYAGDDDYATLEDLSGDEFDELWVEVMVERSESQVRDAEALLEDGRHSGLRAAAEQWIAAHEAALADLEDLLDEREESS